MDGKFCCSHPDQTITSFLFQIKAKLAYINNRFLEELVRQ